MTGLLIVDDETDVREFAANYFRKRNIEVVTASSGIEALAVIETGLPQLILLDIKMENGFDGIETLRRIKERHKDARVIMVTGRQPKEGDAFVKCREMGALDYIHKPLKLDELEEVVLSLLQKN